MRIKNLFCVVLLAVLLVPPPPFSIFLPIVGRNMIDLAHYTIFTPDGESLDLTDAGFTVGVGDIQDGMGMPPVEHKTWNTYNSPGGFLRSIQVGVRVVTINTTLNADCLERLHDLRNKLWQMVRWNRTDSNPPDPARLRYTLNGKSADLYVYYAGDVTARVGNSNVAQTVGVKLVAYDPTWYDPTEVTVPAGHKSDLAVSYIAGKIDGIWSAMGNAGTNTVTSIVVTPDGDTVYIGGIFLNWDGIGAADYIARYTISTDTWASIGAPDGITRAMALAPDGRLYVTGDFLNIGAVAAARIAVYDPVAGLWSALGAGIDAYGQSLALDQEGNLYAGGNFLNAGGGAASHVAKWTVSTSAWSALGNGLDNVVHTLAFSKNGYLYAGGSFLNSGAVPVAYIGVWNGTTWAQVSSGANDIVYAIVVAPSGNIFVGGNFTTIGGVSCSYISKYNGITFSPLGAGTDSTVRTAHVTEDGTLYIGGNFTMAGGIALADRVATWNGSTWGQLDIDLPGATTVRVVSSWEENVFLGFQDSGTAIVSNRTVNVNTTGDQETFPIFTLTGPGTLQNIINETSLDQLVFNMYINPGETITIDLSPGVKSITSSWPTRPNAMASLSLPQSDLGSWSLRPNPKAPSGNNVVSVFMTGTTPAEYNDGSNQLSGWANITGVTCLVTDSNGALYASIVADGGGFYHVNLYSDVARTLLVGHTASYNGVGAKAIVADNGSGLGGTITVDAVTAADSDIVVYFATACISYFNRHLSIDHAMQ